MSAGGWVSVQVLNETVAACRRKLRLAWPEIEELLTAVRANCSVVPLAVEIHEEALALAKRYGFGLNDALICAAAHAAGARTLYTGGSAARPSGRGARGGKSVSCRRLSDLLERAADRPVMNDFT